MTGSRAGPRRSAVPAPGRTPDQKGFRSCPTRPCQLQVLQLAGESESQSASPTESQMTSTCRSSGWRVTSYSTVTTDVIRILGEPQSVQSDAPLPELPLRALSGKCVSITLSA